MTIQHVVLIHLRSEQRHDEIHRMEAALRDFMTVHPEVLDFEVVRDRRLSSGNANLMLRAEFVDDAAFNRYVRSSSHLSFLDEHLRPVLESVATIQY